MVQTREGFHHAWWWWRWCRWWCCWWWWWWWWRSPQNSRDSRGSFVPDKPRKNFTTLLILSSSFLWSHHRFYNQWTPLSLKVRKKMSLLFFFLWMHLDFETLSSITAVALKYVLYCWACPKRIDRQGRNSQMILKHIPLSSPISFSKHSLHIWQVSLLKIVKVLAEEKLIRNKIFLSWI